jgi:hypothetical protein
MTGFETIIYGWIWGDHRGYNERMVLVARIEARISTAIRVGVAYAERVGEIYCFDAVVCTEVIEHLCLPRMLSRFAASLLRPRGLLILSTPCHGYLKNLAQVRYDHLRFNPRPVLPEERRRWASDIAFIGHWEPRTEKGILALRRAGIAVRVRGDGWREKDPDLPGSIHLGSIWNEEYVSAIKSTRVGLGFLSEWNENQTMVRSFEIPACGTFLLAQRTPQHVALYREGIEAVFFDKEEELVRKAQISFADDKRREEVAQPGYRRIMETDHSWQQHMKGDLAKVQERLARTQQSSGSNSNPSR